MNGMHQNNNHNFEKTNPGCLGRMVNLFELNLGVSSNMLLTDKPHQDGSPLSRSRSDASNMSPSGDKIEDKVILSELKNISSNRKSNATPMKTLIAQEMSKEVDTRKSAPNLVAKLMGLDALPREEPDSAMQRSQCKGHPRSNSDIPLSRWEQQNEFFHCVEPNEYKDVYDIWQQSPKSPHKQRYDKTTNDKKMALVRQNFVEAKRLSMDQKLRQSKQFQDALEVLNSNKDLFLKCLQEPNTMLSQHLHNLQSITPPETKRITVLRPSKMVDSINSAGAGDKDRKQMKKTAFVQPNGLERSHLGCSPPSNWTKYENSTQPTRIVVLKPSLGKPHDIKDVGWPQSESPRILLCENIFDEAEEENQESREVAKAVTQQMREKLARLCRDETLISSVFSNGYVGDESSFNKSEIDYVAGNLSDSEAMSPVSRQSWDYANRLSPYSSSSISRASYSPESSVCREAKKRLSERWAMMATNGSCQEQRYFRRSSSTLGEMLALSESKKAAMPSEDGISSEEPKNSNSLLVSEQRTNEIMDNSSRNLMRSKSLPVSSTEFGSRLSVDISVSDKGKPEAPKEESKARNPKSSWKVSSLFFSRNKKPSIDNSLASETKDEFVSTAGEVRSNKPESLGNKGPNHFSLGLLEPSSGASSANLIGKYGRTVRETGFSDSKPLPSGNSGENHDESRPIYVLDPPYEEERHTAKTLLHYVKPDRQGVELPVNPVKSKLIGKSPPIGSIARTLPLDNSCVNTASSYPVNETLATTQGTYKEEQEWFIFVKTLLTVAGLEDEVQSNSFLTKWHSPESPLDPSLRDNYIDLKDKETLHEAKRRQKRSIRKLVFDCVNVVLLEIAGYRSESNQRAIPCIGVQNGSSTMVDEVWAQMNGLFSGELDCVSDDCGEENSLVVEKVVRKEVVGKGWIGHLRLEMDNLRKEIEGELLEELVQEMVTALTSTF
ncbi:hypothetical protein ACJIZ3_016913 [Penstemon smallii]|uniref:DUF4378 domain-containing protein n=1 Tax=Penstemon smallii TaxID=265156 RepID=A0ABD3SU29_9LAMI